MQDMAIPGRVIAYALWVVGFVAVGASFFGPHQLASVGLLLAMGGATLQVRTYICNLHHRERTAFDLGRDSVRSLR